ncbi:uncharacterized protein BDZ99DRAFT_514848 [Mytilinidion resinicola]|uniref:C2H2 type master regulator of conidiophore development brlA n=1 Tax=Mytilinidion resinicola TaxID=574789 RepID=A0A6A6Z549_9PEZI|nr:uncharacterized protein BDZ99DRAFT_514848 [Mytilinidion resinicola]KAF2816251.1 hypothetical protein BDZ99DRAFT_514848 [Mytilinidion resinicola]
MDSTHPSPSLHPHFRQSMKAPTLGQSPSYPSPARSDSAVNYSPDGLGLYNYSITLPVGQPQNASTLYPPSPQPTEAWNPHMSSSTSPLMPEVLADQWPSLYDPPVTRSPLSWNQAFSYPPPGLVDPNRSPGLRAHHHYSHRSSVSSSNETSMYSRAGSEAVFTPNVKLEAPHDWLDDGDVSPHGVLRQQPLTVSPDRLSNNALYRYDYGSPTLQMMDSEAAAESAKMEDRNSRSAPPERRRSSGRREHFADRSSRMRIRRNPTTPQNANYACEICHKLFQRSYNHKAHMTTHDPLREHPHKCPYPNCQRGFVRKTDLSRHEQSVHVKTKNFKCAACEAHFARRDTLRRHEEDGCPRRFEVGQHNLIPLRTATSRSAGSPDGPATVRQEYDSPADSSPAGQPTPLFKTEDFSRL